jgi:hypothetical protein
VRDEFRGRSTLAGDDGRMVIGWNDGRALALRQSLRDLLAVLEISVVCHDAAAVGSRGLNFGCRGIIGHDDGGADAEDARGQRNRLRMVSR